MKKASRKRRSLLPTKSTHRTCVLLGLEPGALGGELIGSLLVKSNLCPSSEAGGRRCRGAPSVVAMQKRLRVTEAVGVAFRSMSSPLWRHWEGWISRPQLQQRDDEKKRKVPLLPPCSPTGVSSVCCVGGTLRASSTLGRKLPGLDFQMALSSTTAS